MPVREHGRRPTSGRTGCSRSWSRRSSSPSGPPTASCAIRSISGCATTRSRRRPAREQARLRRSTADVRDARRRRERRADEPRTQRPPNGERRTDERRTPRAVVDQLDALEKARQRRRARAARTAISLKVTNLHKVFWPKLKLTKGDLFRYYARVAPFILPAVADRPLVMKRFPNGVAAPPFYQHRAPEVPPGVRIERRQRRREAAADHRRQPEDAALHDAARRDLAGSVVLARAASASSPTTCALDLDPSEGVPFARVLDVARWIRDELDALGAVGVPKTSGADGLHIYIPLPPGTPYEAGLLFCQIVATVVAQKHPKVATVERSVARARQARLRRLPAEHPRQDAGDRLQRARQRVRRRLDAADLGGGRRRRRSPGVHDRDGAGAVREGRRSVGGAAEIERRGPERASRATRSARGKRRSKGDKS